MNEAEKLRITFDQEALLYNRARPRYPSALFDALIGASGLGSDAKLLEIGPGTGQATKPLAERGYAIIGVELGTELAKVARHELRDHPRVEVITGVFENIDLPVESFDLVYAATALHWVKPELRYAKPHHLLKLGGHLAIIHTHHVSDEQGDAFFRASQVVYDRYYGKGDAPVLPVPAQVRPDELDTVLFELSHFERFPLVIQYTAHEYAELLNTYSPTLALPREVRISFLGDMVALINDQFEGRVDKHLVMSLTVGRKR